MKHKCLAAVQVGCWTDAGRALSGRRDVMHATESRAKNEGTINAIGDKRRAWVCAHTRPYACILVALISRSSCACLHLVWTSQPLLWPSHQPDTSSSGSNSLFPAPPRLLRAAIVGWGAAGKTIHAPLIAKAHGLTLRAVCVRYAFFFFHVCSTYASACILSIW